MTRPRHIEPAPPAAWMLPGLRQRSSSDPGDLDGAIHPDLFEARSRRLAEQELDRERERAQQRDQKRRDAALRTMRDKLRAALRSKRITEGQKNAIGEALSALDEGRVDDALAILEEHA